MRNVRFENRSEPRAKHSFLIQRDLAEVTYDQVAKELGMSVARVGQIERAGLARLKACFELIESGVPVDDAIEQCKGRPGRPKKVTR